MRRCAICHAPIDPLFSVIRTKRPHVTVCLYCLGIRRTEDGELYRDPDLDRTHGKWDDEF